MHELEQAIEDWAGSFEATPRGASEPLRMSPESVTLHRAGDFGSEWLWFITCDSSTHPEQGQWAWTGVATRDDSGRWSAHGISGGSCHPLVTAVPWVNLGGQFLEDGFRAGGWVEDAGRHIAAVRVSDRNGVVLDDDVENHVVLFRSDRPVALPVTIHLIDETGAIAATECWP